MKNTKKINILMLFGFMFLIKPMTGLADYKYDLYDCYGYVHDETTYEASAKCEYRNNNITIDDSLTSGTSIYGLGGDEDLYNGCSVYSGLWKSSSPANYIVLDNTGAGQIHWYGFKDYNTAYNCAKQQGDEWQVFIYQEEKAKLKEQGGNSTDDSEDTYVCTYEVNNYNIRIIHNAEKQKFVIESLSDHPEINIIDMIGTKEFEKGACVQFYVCYRSRFSGVSNYYFFGDSLAWNQYKNNVENVDKYDCIDSISNSVENNTKENSAECTTLKDMVEDIETYKSNKNYEEADKLTSTIKKLCQNLVQTADFTDPCLQDCLNLNDELSEDSSTNSGVCGFSDRLIAWVVNIIKWLKYIVPALIIIFSMIDVVKSIGSDKDDEMQKAKQKLVKRLIVAVLIFIIPLIIEFVLGKFGFVYEDCGIL